MKKLLFILLLCAGNAYANKYAFEDPKLNDEFDNVYVEISNVLKGDVRISSVTMSSITVSNNLDMTGHKITNLANGTVSTDAAAYGQITSLPSAKVLQTSSATNTGTTSSTSTSYSSTTLQVTITPTSSASRIVLWVTTYCFINANGATLTYGILRSGAGDLVASGMAQTTMALAGRCPTPANFVYVDAPSSTSALTYVLRMKSSGGGVDVRDNVDNILATMYVQEIQ